jgi:methylated-DNA-[protein]-cysteine S-methyltransferase
MDSPAGQLLLTATPSGLSGLYFSPHKGGPAVQSEWHLASEPFQQVQKQLGEYFTGNRTKFDLKLDPQGTEFQHTVWAALQRIPYGATRSYGEIAEEIGQPKAVRAVANANARNPLTIIVPCHRVIGTNRSLTGYAGGLEKKSWLLELEQLTVFRQDPLIQQATELFSAAAKR